MPSRILVPILVLLLSATALAAPPEWVCHGPWGGLSLSITVDEKTPDRAFVTTALGYFLSDDAGATWSRAALPGPLRPTPMMMVRGRLWTEDKGIIRSSADGREWTAEGPVNGRLIAIGEGSGASGPLRALIASPVSRGHVLFRVLVQEDFGWATVARFEEKIDPRAWPAGRILGHPDQPKVVRIFLTNLDAADATIHYGSDDGGRTWERWVASPRLWDVVALRGEGAQFGGLSLHPARPPAGLFVSVDGGRTWKPTSQDPDHKPLRSLAVGPDGRLLIGTVKQYILDTTPTFAKVEVLRTGLANENVSAMAIHPGNPKRVWAGTQCGLFRSDDGGSTFVPASNGLAAGQFTGLATTEKSVLAFEYHQGMRWSEDGARTWKPLDLEWRNRFGKVFGVVSRGDAIAASTGDGAKDWRITISRDGGRTWSMRRFPFAVLAAGIGPKGEIYVSKRGGALLRVAEGVELEAFAAGFEKLGGEVSRVRPLADGKRLLLLGTVGAATCDVTDGGNITMIDPPLAEPLYWPAAEIDVGDAVYVVGKSGRMYRHVLPDGGWETVVEKGGPQRLVGVVSDPGAKDRRYAAFVNGFVMVSEDAGRTWKTLKRFNSCMAIKWGPPRRLHVVADGAVWSCDLPKAD